VQSQLFEVPFIQVDALHSSPLLCWVQKLAEMRISMSFRHNYISFQPLPSSILV